MKGKKLKNKIIISALVISIIFSSVVAHNLVINKEARKSKASSEEVINFTYSSAAFDDDSKHLVNEGVFDSDFFAKSSKEYNHGLARLSQAFALASGSTSESTVNWGENFDYVINTTVDDKDIDYTIHRNAYIVEVYKQLGFYNDEYVKYEVSLNDTSNTSAYSIAMKKITVNDEEYTLVCATPRSGVYGAEWASNFYLTNKDNKCGFQLAGEDFYEGIKDYIKRHNLGKNTKVWINGYSRGAGVANVAAACMDKDIAGGVYEFGKEDVYAYMCATPMATLDSDYNSEIYNNIFNIVIESDLVATVAPSYWGFNRYGNVVTIPHMYTSASDLKKN